jgi:hypothetical protein
MAVIFRQVNNAYRAHWRAHDSKYPQKLVLTTSQADDLLLCQRYGQVSFPGAQPPQRDRFNDRPIEITDSTPGEIVAHDGTVTPLSDYDEFKA